MRQILRSHDIRTAITLRALVALGLALLLLSTRPLQELGAGYRPGAGEWILLGFLLSNVAPLAAGQSAWRWRPFDLILVTLDTFLISLLLYPLGGTHLALVFFLVLLLVALGERLPVQLVGATAVAGLDAWLTVRTGAAITPGLLLRVPFFYSAALYYGYFVGRAREEKVEAEQARSESEELRTVVEILREVTSSLDLEGVMRRVVRHVSKIVPVERISILRLEAESGGATVLASSDCPDLQPLELDLGKYPEVQEAIRLREPLLLENLWEHEILADVRHHMRHLPWNSLLVVPLVFAEEAVGTLLLRAASRRMTFYPDQVRFFQAVSTASANALKNAVLHKELAEAAERYRATATELANLLDHSPDMIVSTDSDGRIARWNRGAERILGWTSEEVSGKPLADLYPHLADETATRRLDAGRPVLEHEGVLERADGERVEADVTVVLLEPERGRAGGLLLVGRDVTELNQSRRALKRADRLSGLGEIVSGVAHELNNPLSGVLGHGQLLASHEDLSPETRRDAERIVENAKRCRRIVRNLLGFARRRAPEETMVSVSSLLDTVLDLCDYQIKANDIKIVRDVARDLPSTLLDPHRMEQVFLNLIQNSVRSLHQAGRPGTVLVRCFRDDGEIVVEVTDDGPGVPEELREKIFEPFFTTRGEEGTGLGLSIAAGIVEEHGGRLELAAAPETSGATFRVHLPLRTLRRGSLAAAGRPAEPRGRGRRVLVVATDAGISEPLLRVLRKESFRADAMISGKDAARALEISEGYDLVVAEIEGPTPNGAALAERFGNQVPFVLISGDPLVARRYGEEAGDGAWPLVRKPLDLDEVLDVIEAALALRDEGPERAAL